MEELAKKEAENLKQYATPEEINLLSIDNLDPNDVSRCIYGQMTGHCDSERAEELIIQCCEKVYDTSHLRSDFTRATLNGKPYTTEKTRRYSYYSPIELLITQRYGDYIAGRAIIKYLRGETSELNF